MFQRGNDLARATIHEVMPKSHPETTGIDYNVMCLQTASASRVDRNALTVTLKTASECHNMGTFLNLYYMKLFGRNVTITRLIMVNHKLHTTALVYMHRC